MRVVLGVTGCIAAYKAAEIVRALIKAGADVRVVMTRHATEFLAPLTLESLSGHPVAVGQYELGHEGDAPHITLVRESEVLLIAPATANVLGKMASGVADDLLTSLYRAYTGPVVVAPAMNTRMWCHPRTQEAVRQLRADGVALVEPEEGWLADREEGVGRLAEPAKVVEAGLRAGRRSRAWSGRQVVVSAGPTREPIDPVRFLSNHSSGKMGYAIAAAARQRGATVTLVSGPVRLGPPWGVTLVPVETALEMKSAVEKAAAGADLAIMSAAVADFRPRRTSARKLPKEQLGGTLELEPNPDILAGLVDSRPLGQVIVGFAAETGDALVKGTSKRRRKGCDLIVINDVTAPGAGFGTDTNQVTLVGPEGTEAWPLLSKREVAERLLDRIDPLLPKRPVRRARPTTRRPSERGRGRRRGVRS
jgi:phosphopantothenoylcysteine decarboxylase/phosphopantothenate--cysteine ligase